jgi:hypothetical protein
MKRYAKFIVVAVLAVMPLQGVAATLSALSCHGEAQGHAMHAGGAHEHGTLHDGQPHRQDGAGDTSGNAVHPCCHHCVAAPAAVALAVTPPELPAHARAPRDLQDLFVPDRPQRPPLA